MNCLTRLGFLRSSLELLGSGSRRRAFLCSRTQVIAGWRPSHAKLLLLASADNILQLLAYGLSSPTATSRLTHSFQLYSRRRLDCTLNCLVLATGSLYIPSVRTHRKHCRRVRRGVACSIAALLVCLAPDRMATPLPRLCYCYVTSL
jgi:hypothetical protein